MLKGKRIGSGLYEYQIGEITIWVELNSTYEGYDHNHWVWNLPGDYPSDIHATKRDAVLALQEAIETPEIWNTIIAKHKFFNQ